MCSFFSQPYRRKSWLLFSICVASFLEPLATTVVTVSLPHIQRSIGATFADLQWVINAYVLTFAALVLTGGALADKLGRRRIFITGLWIFILASLLCGFALTPLMLILGRAAEGIGAAFMLSAGLALLVQVFEGKERVRAFAFWGVVVGAGSALGPLVGGLITDRLGWRWAFFINIPVCVILAWLTLRTADESQDPLAHSIDWPGLLSFTLMFFLLMYVLIEGNKLGWSSLAVIFMLSGAIILLLIFIWGQLRQSRPMFDLSLFKNRTFTGASIVAVAIAAAFFTLLVYLPVYLQGVLGYTPTLAGLALLPMAVPLLIMGPISAYMAAMLSSRWLLPLGLLIIALGALVMSKVSIYPQAAVYAGMVITGIGAGLINGELSNVAISVIAPERGGMASGINNTMRQLGFGVGIAGLGAVFAAGLMHRLSHYGESFVGQVSSGDIAAAVSHISGDQSLAREAAIKTLTTGISSLSLLAAILAFIAAILALLLIAPERSISELPVNTK